MTVARNLGGAAGRAPTFLDRLPSGGVIGLAAGAAVVGGLYGAGTARTDGSRRVRPTRDADYTLRPESQEAARASIQLQRLWGGGIGLLGGVALGSSLMRLPKGGSALSALAGAGMLGWGVGRLMRLHGAEATVDPALPEKTPAGRSDMVRTDSERRYNVFTGGTSRTYDGTGYNIYGFSTSPGLLESLSAPHVEEVPAFTTPSLLERLRAQTEIAARSTSTVGG